MCSGWCCISFEEVVTSHERRFCWCPSFKANIYILWRIERKVCILVVYYAEFSVTNQEINKPFLLFSFFFHKVLFPELKSHCRAEHNAARSADLSVSRCVRNWTHVPGQNKKMFLFPSFIQTILCRCHHSHIYPKGKALKRKSPVFSCNIRTRQGEKKKEKNKTKVSLKL